MQTTKFWIASVALLGLLFVGPPLLPEGAPDVMAQTQEREPIRDPIDDPTDPDPNTAPDANNDTDETDEGQSTTTDVLANDSDSDGYLDATSVTVSSQPSNGSASVGSYGNITYTPDSGFSGTDTYTYLVQDDDGAFGSATVTITVNAVQPTTEFKSLNRSVSGEVPGVVDGRVSSDWDFTDQSFYTLYYDDPEGGGIQSNSTQLPQYAGLGPATASFSAGDLDPAKGWRLIQRDFGNASRAPAAPYYMLYNKYSGILRLFLYNTAPGEYTFSSARLSHASTGDKTSTLEFEDPRASINDYVDGTRLETVSDAGAGWIYADFNLQSYDPDVSSAANAQYQLKLVGVRESDVQLEGGITLQQVLASSSGSSISFADIGAAREQGKRNFSKVTDALSWIQTEADSAEANDKWYADIMTDLAATADDVSSFGPWVGAAVGVIKTFLGSGNGGSTPLRFRGDLELSGDITTDFKLFALTFRVPGADHPANPSAGRPIPAYDQPTGILGIRNRPEVYSSTDFQSESGCQYYVEYYRTYSFDAPTVVVNPQADISISDTDFQFYSDSGRTSWGSASQVEGETVTDGIDGGTFGCYAPARKFFEMGLRVVYRPSQNPGNFDDFVYMKSFEEADTPSKQQAVLASTSQRQKSAQTRDRIASFGVEMASRNPVRRVAQWEVQTPETSTLSLRVYNTLGQMVIEKRVQTSAFGRKQVSVSSSTLSPGSYFARFHFSSSEGEKVVTRRFTVVK